MRRIALLTCMFAGGLALLASLATARAADADWPYEPGPPAQRNKQIAFLMEDSRNGGIAGALRGFEAAAVELGWTVRTFDARGEPARARAAMGQALDAHFDGIVLGGMAVTAMQDGLTRARRLRVPVVGWHAAEQPGPAAGLFQNVTTPTAAVAEQVAALVVAAPLQKIGVVLITDSRFPVARRKVAEIHALLERCARCSVLTVEDIPIARARERVPSAVLRWAKEYGARWSHTVAINDIYFDHMNAPLREAGRADVLNISAGDGSATALARIRGGRSQQQATVAEPLDLQGWQLADELNRAFAGRPPSRFVSRPIVLDAERLQTAADMSWGQDYRAAYARTWRQAPAGEAAARSLDLISPRPDSGIDERIDYPIALLETALREAGVAFTLRPSHEPMNQGRALAELEAGRSVSVVWTMTSIERERRLRPVRIPIHKGLFGWRLPLVRIDTLPQFAAVRTLEDLKPIAAGQGHDWPDTQILRHHGFNVVTSVDPNLFAMLSAYRFDWFPRAVPEIWQEVRTHAADGLVVEPTLALYYPTAIYYFFRKEDETLARQVENALEQAVRSGSFDRLFNRHHRELIERARLPARRVFSLDNPLLPPDTPLGRKELWFAPSTPRAPAPRSEFHPPASTGNADPTGLADG